MFSDMVRLALVAENMKPLVRDSRDEDIKSFVDSLAKLNQAELDIIAKIWRKNRV